MTATNGWRGRAFAAGCAVASAAASSSCTDFGYRLPPAADAAPADAAAGDSAGACTEGVAPASNTGPQVQLVTLSVNKPALAIARGDVVTWTNTDTMPHTVTAGAPGAQLPPAQGGFDSGTIAPGTRWAYRFCTARTVFYFCKTHASQMNNYRVVVGP